MTLVSASKCMLNSGVPTCSETISDPEMVESRGALTLRRFGWGTKLRRQAWQGDRGQPLMVADGQAGWNDGESGQRDGREGAVFAVNS